MSHTGEGPSDELVSVIIPCYNGERYLAETIRSALNQTHGNLELIIVDDGSSDGSKRVIEEFTDDPRVVFIEHHANKGIPGTRNDGAAAARGEYLTFLDQDDLWLPTRIEDQLKVFRENAGNNVGMVFSDILGLENGLYAYKASPHRKIPPNFNDLPVAEVLGKLFVVNFINILTALIPRQCLVDVGGFDEDILSGADDYDLFLRIAARYKVLYLDSILGIHRLHRSNYYSLPGSIEDELKIARKLLAAEPVLTALKKKKYGALNDSLGTYHFLNGDYHQAARHFREAVRNDPANPTHLFKWLLCSSIHALPGNLPDHLYGLGKKLWHLLGDLGSFFRKVS